MHRLRDEGKIRAIGLSCYVFRDFKRLVPRIQPSVVQAWAHCMDSHFINNHAPMADLCKEYHCSFLGFSPLNQGILLNKYDASNPPIFPPGDHRSSSEKFKAPYLARAQKGLTAIEGRFGSATDDYARVALQFVLYHQMVAATIAGFRNVSQIKTLLAATEKPLNGDDIAFIRKAFC